MSSRYLIVCSGPSLGYADIERIKALPASVRVIAVNGAIGHIPARTNVWFTLDVSLENLDEMHRRRPGVQYVAALPEGVELACKPQALQERFASVPEHVERLRRMEGGGVLGSLPGLSEHKHCINTGNSGYGAMGLAYHDDEAQRIAIVGLDGKAGCYFYGGRGPRGRIDHLPALFSSAVPQLQRRGIYVVNGSPKSAIQCFPRISPAEALDWIERP
jgi:hypothetical protein